MNVNLAFCFMTLALGVLVFQRSFSTISRLYESVNLLFSKDLDSGSLELLFLFYIVLAPISFNTLIICMLGKYTLESRRSMTRCYLYSSALLIFAILLSYFQCSVYSNIVTDEILFFNAIELSSLFLTNLEFSAMLFKSEIDELKRINRVKKLGACLVFPNIKVLVLLALYFLWFAGILLNLWYKVWYHGVGFVKVSLASFIFSTNAAILSNYIYIQRTRI